MTLPFTRANFDDLAESFCRAVAESDRQEKGEWHLILGNPAVKMIEDGRAAFRARQPRKQNPYPPYSPAYSLWEAGFQNECEQAESTLVRALKNYKGESPE